MGQSNEELYGNALEAIRNLFSDTSVSIENCKANLQSLKDEIDAMIDTLVSDLEDGDGW